MSFQNCSLVFNDSPQRVFFSGQTVNGMFNINQAEPKKIQSMLFSITGETRVRWSESHGTGRYRRTVVYSGHEIYFKTPPINLTGGYPTLGGNVEIPSGLSSFNFSVQLPPMLPSSFEGVYGKIRYYITVAIARSYKMDKFAKFPFTVICMSDLNANPANSIPLRQTLSQDYSFLLAKKGTLHMTVDLPMVGYVPGQQVPVTCSIRNDSKIKIANITMCVERMVTYSCLSPYPSCRYGRDKLVEYIGKGVDKGEEINFQVALVIPGVPPSSTFPSLITFQYFLKVRAIAGGMHSNLKCHIPINVGNVPVNMRGYNGEASTSAGPDDPSGSGQASAPPPEYEYTQMGLPTYEESQISSKMEEADPDDDDSGTAYAPRYPVYQFNMQKPLLQ